MHARVSARVARSPALVRQSTIHIGVTMYYKTCFAATMLAVVTGCGNFPFLNNSPSIKAGALGLPGTTISKSIANQLCLDVDSALSLPYRTPLQKWAHIVRTYGLPVDTLEAGGNNEMHDCQGLIGNVDGAQKYTAFGTLWVSDVLERKTFEGRTVVAAITLVGAQYPIGDAVLAPNRNCLLLQGTRADDNGANWRAWIVRIDDHHKCPTGNTMTGGTELNVYRDPARGKAVAGRWVDMGNAYYIGLQCGDYFCVIGVDTKGQPPAGYNRRWAADSDHQRLAKKNADGLLVPSRLEGTINASTVPNADVIDPFHDTFREVATATLKGPDSEDAWMQYASKWYLPLAMLKTTPIKLYLHHTGGDDASGWSSRWGSSDLITPVKFLRADHSGMNTVRWRWSPGDETTWRQCPSGCCGN